MKKLFCLTILLISVNLFSKTYHGSQEDHGAPVSRLKPALPPKYTYHILEENRAPADAQLPSLKVALENLKQYSVILVLLKKASLLEALNDLKGFTFFPPTDQAFSQFEHGVGHEQFMHLIDDPTTLKDIIYRMILPEEYPIKMLKNIKQVMTINGVLIDIVPDNGTILLNEYSKVVDPDIETSNGIIHGVNALVLP